MKNFILIGIILAVNLQTKAETITVEAQLQTYKEATISALSDNGKRELRCSSNDDSWHSLGLWTMNDLIQKAQEIVVNESSQPRLTFKLKNVNINAYSVDFMQIKITTSSDDKQIFDSEGLIYTMGKINSGDLRNPQISEGLVFRALCKIKKQF